MKTRHRVHLGARLKVLLTTLLLVLAGLGAAVGSAQQAVASIPANGWGLPAGTGYVPSTGFLANECGHPEYGRYVAGKYHTGNDLGNASGISEGTDVTTIGSGTVIAISSGASSGWSWGTPGHTNDNSAVMIRHTATDGSEFVALYGHIVPTVAVNAVVAKGDKIGDVGYYGPGNAHLHFGIHPGSGVPGGSLGTGSCPATWPPSANGFVDPIPYLDAHPATGGGSGSIPSAPSTLRAVTHPTQVTLAWNGGSGATSYEVSRDGIVLGTASSGRFLDSGVSENQTYTYAVAAINSVGRSASVTLEVRTTRNNGDRAWVTTSSGPALCGRSGSETVQTLVCTVKSGSSFTTIYSSSTDWGYPENRSWVENADGTVDYCRLVGSATTDQRVMCTTFTGTGFSADVTSSSTDWGYPENRTWVTTSSGPALCGRSGMETLQTLVCTVKSGSVYATVYSSSTDWGYPENRAWVENADGTVDYCRLTGSATSDQRAMCTPLTGTSFGTSTTSSSTDWGFPENRTWVTTSSGPALCGRAGSATDQKLVCTKLTSSGFVKYVSSSTDWGYPENRAWVENADGTVDYCRLVGMSTDQHVMCTELGETGFSASVLSSSTDWAYPENRAWVSMASGPALCGRSGSETQQTLVCTVKSGTSFAMIYASARDWGYPDNRAWVQNSDGTVSYCALVGVVTDQKITCNNFTGSSFGSPVVSGSMDWGYADTP